MSNRTASLASRRATFDDYATCTVGPSAVTGERCGQPAVASFVGRNGEHFYECIEHAMLPRIPSHAKVGA